MNQLLDIRSPHELKRFERPEGLPALDPEDLVCHKPDTHLVLVDANGCSMARCSIWWEGTPSLAHHRVGVIGHYSSDTPEAAQQLLAHACTRLSAQGCSLAIGPMDGSTWRNYRFITESGSAPPFFLEPDHPPDWPQNFVEAGFSPLARYCSSATDRFDCSDPRATLVGQRLHGLGVRLRPLEFSQWQEELKAIYQVTTASFRKGFLYQPITEAAFQAQYGKLRSLVRSDLVWLATHENRVVGFLFAIPDWLQARRGQKVDTFVIKTLAVLPGRIYAGLGRYLTQQVHRVAWGLGYRRAIHALMHEGNASLNISAWYGDVFRRYTLFATLL